MEEEDHFTLTQLPALIDALAAAVMAAGLLPLAAPLSLLFSTALLSRSALLSWVPIYRQQWCHQLQLFFNKGGCQLQLFFNNGGCQSQWLVPSICCTLIATNPTDSSFNDLKIPSCLVPNTGHHHIAKKEP
jgi:hypothetical protein